MGPFRELCNKTGLSQASLARRAGVSLRTVERWLSGDHGTPFPWCVARVAVALKIDFEALQDILTAQVRLAARARAGGPPNPEKGE